MLVSHVTHVQSTAACSVAPDDCNQPTLHDEYSNASLCSFLNEVNTVLFIWSKLLHSKSQRMNLLPEQTPNICAWEINEQQKNELCYSLFLLETCFWLTKNTKN